jgi:acyl-CoA reductase-like NAD-dependent aldehyde dehydrogenase
VSPVDGRVYAERPVASAAEIETAVGKGKAARKAWGEITVRERAKFLNHFVDALLGKNDEIVPELAWQMGRPVRYGGERKGVEERSRYMIDIAEAALAPSEKPGKDGFRRWIAHEPLGTVMVIAPWNYPFLTAVNSIVPALMAGNSVILKHASQTLLVGERFAEAMHAAGLPDGLFQNLVLNHADTEKLIASGQIDHINFTGSVEGGRRIERAAAGTFATLGLELGGKDPAYVRADAKLDHAVENLVDGSFFNSGQSCCGVERIYVARAIFKRFVDVFVDLAKQYRLGNPLDKATTLGPMVRADAAGAVRSQIREAVSKGAKALIDAKAFPADKEGTPYLAPQVLVDVDHSMQVMTEESFGPVVGIMPVDSDEEAIRLMNDSRYGLTASIWTADADAAVKLGDRIETGTCFMNRCDYLDPALAWTGVKDSGRGCTLSQLGFEAFTRPKSFHLRPAP